MALVCLVQNFQLINSRLFLGVSHSGSMTFWVNGFKCVLFVLSLGVLREMIHLTRIFFNRDEEVVFVWVFFFSSMFFQ